MRWRRVDVPGREESRLEQTIDGWRLSGKLEIEESGLIAQLSYVIECDPAWRTRSADVLGEANDKPVAVRLDVDEHGRVLRYEGLWEAETSGPTS